MMPPQDGDDAHLHEGHERLVARAHVRARLLQGIALHTQLLKHLSNLQRGMSFAQMARACQFVLAPAPLRGGA